MPNQHLPHLNIPFVSINEDYSKRQKFVDIPVPQRPTRNRIEHGEHLKAMLSAISRKLEELDLPKSVIIKFTGKEGFFLTFENFTRKTEDVELMSVNQFSVNGQDIHYANVRFKSAKAFEKYEKFLDEYSHELGSKVKIELLDEIENIEISYFEALFTDNKKFYPANRTDRLWLEIWLDKKERGVKEKYNAHISKHGILHNPDFLELKDRLVSLVYASIEEIDSFILGASYITEIRRAKYIKHFLDFSSAEQYSFIEDLHDRIEEHIGTTVVIMDSGVNVANDMIRNYVVDRLTIDETIGVNDIANHGTGMASLVLYGDLQNIFETSTPIIINSNILSLKIFDNQKPYETEVIKAAYNLLDDDKKIYTMAVTSESDGSGNPSAFSSAIDNFIAVNKKLFFISAGNIQGISGLDASSFNDLQQSAGISDPAQSWNAITVGAYTEKCNISHCFPGNRPFAEKGDLSPYSRTSTSFLPKWPIKPEVVFEGGNIEFNERENILEEGYNNLSLIACDSKYSPVRPFPPFTFFNATSAATALATKFATELISEYPHYWPETIRGLMIHSARWTSKMKARVGRNPKKNELKKWLKMFGYGVPNIERARWSTHNSLSMILEQEFQLYRKLKNDQNKEQIMFIPLPWPKEYLLNEISDKLIKLTVTLSHFVYTNASSRGYSTNKYSYQPYFLQFRLKPANTSEQDFIAAVNKLKLDEQKASMDEEEFKEYKSSIKNDCNWGWGINQRRSGSVIKDVIKTTGAELAEMDKIAIYPEPGWMKEDTSLTSEDLKTRFSLIISLEVAEGIDLYTPIQTTIENIISVPVEV